MEFAHQTFLNTSIVDWAQILGGVLAVATMAGWLVKYFRKGQISEIISKDYLKQRYVDPERVINEIGESHAVSFDKALDRATIGIVAAPVAYNLSKNLVDKFSDHALDAISAHTSMVADPLTGHVLGAGADLIMDHADSHYVAADAAHSTIDLHLHGAGILHKFIDWLF